MLYGLFILLVIFAGIAVEGWDAGLGGSNKKKDDKWEPFDPYDPIDPFRKKDIDEY